MAQYPMKFPQIGREIDIQFSFLQVNLSSSSNRAASAPSRQMDATPAENETSNGNETLAPLASAPPAPLSVGTATDATSLATIATTRQVAFSTGFAVTQPRPGIDMLTWGLDQPQIRELRVGKMRSVVSKGFVLHAGGGDRHEAKILIKPHGKSFRDGPGRLKFEVKCNTLDGAGFPVFWLSASSDGSFQGPTERPPSGLLWDFGASIKTESFAVLFVVVAPWRLENSQ